METIIYLVDFTCDHDRALEAVLSLDHETKKISILIDNCMSLEEEINLEKITGYAV